MPLVWRTTSPVVRKERLPPDADGLVDALSGIGYSMMSAVADILDNSIDAAASVVLVRLWQQDGELLGLDIVDNGSGMSEAQLRQALVFGHRRAYAEGDIGKFGMGLKSASLSQAAELTVFSRKDGKGSGRAWTSLDVKQDWQSHVIDSDFAERVLDQPWLADLSTQYAGTVVRWSRVREFSRAKANLGSFVERFMADLNAHLGLHFHRLLESGRIRIYVDVANAGTCESGAPLTVAPRNPFGYPKSGATGYPRDFTLHGDGWSIDLRAHVWPDLPKHPNYALGRAGGATKFQGFYFYRADRLIQAGGWNSLLSDEPHRSRARVEIDLPRDIRGFSLKYDKAGINPPLVFLEEVRGAQALKRSATLANSFEEYLAFAVEVARSSSTGEAKLEPIYQVETGLSRQVRAALQQFPSRPGRKMKITWASLPASKVFDVDRDRGVLRLNRRLRSLLASEETAKLLLFLLVNDEFGRERVRSHRAEALKLLNAAIISTEDD